MSTHSFDIEHATEFGLAEAVLIKNFQLWINHNIDQKYNFKDERVWTYITLKELAKNFSYLSEKQVRTAIDHLVADGVLMKGNYNKLSFDKTIWYAFVDEKRFVKPYNLQVDTSAQSGKRGDQEGETIPCTLNIYSNTDTTNTNTMAKKSKSISMPPSLEEVKSYFREKGYREDVAIKAFEYYSSNDWKDKNDSPVKNWRLKMHVWFKDSARIQNEVFKVRDTFGSIHFKTQQEINKAEKGFFNKI
jgi:hypothetical protein